MPDDITRHKAIDVDFQTIDDVAAENSDPAARAPRRPLSREEKAALAVLALFGAAALGGLAVRQSAGMTTDPVAASLDRVSRVQDAHARELAETRAALESLAAAGPADGPALENIQSRIELLEQGQAQLARELQRVSARLPEAPPEATARLASRRQAPAAPPLPDLSLQAGDIPPSAFRHGAQLADGLVAGARTGLRGLSRAALLARREAAPCLSRAMTPDALEPALLRPPTPCKLLRPPV